MIYIPRFLEHGIKPQAIAAWGFMLLPLYSVLGTPPSVTRRLPSSSSLEEGAAAVQPSLVLYSELFMASRRPSTSISIANGMLFT